MAALANHLAERDAISPLKRRMATWRKEQERHAMAQEKPHRESDDLWRLAEEEANERAPYPRQSPLSAAIIFGPLLLIGLTFYNELAGVSSARGAWAAIGCAVLFAIGGAWDIHSKRALHSRARKTALERLSWWAKHPS
jgi:hypothetical protein